MNSLTAFDQKVRNQGFKYVAGADESGRGSLAGPLVAAAVIFPEKTVIENLQDCKKVIPKRREELFEKIVERALAWNIVVMEAKEIDRRGLQKANVLALEKALQGLDPKPDYILTDRYEAASLKIPHLGVIKGDVVSASIAAASILAKVTRDKIMEKYGKIYPKYGFEVHKGYGTAAHLKALKRWGPSKIHRKSFAHVHP